MTNDELSEIDAILAVHQPIPYLLAKELREALARCAADAVRLRKESCDNREDAWKYRELCK
jgi:hypothetical protein